MQPILGKVLSINIHLKQSLFLTLALGYAVGKVQIDSFKVGSDTSFLITGFTIEQSNITVDATVKSVVFLLFICARL